MDGNNKYFSLLFLFLFTSIGPISGGLDIVNTNEIETVKGIAISKAKDFANLLQILADQDYSSVTKKMAATAAVNLFTKNSSVEVSSLISSELIMYPIDEYLYNLNEFGGGDYRKIVFEFKDFRVDELSKLEDGVYNAKVIYNQRFTGENKNGKITYSDNTTSMDVIVRKETSHLEMKYWKGKLSNIKIIKTVRKSP